MSKKKIRMNSIAAGPDGTMRPGEVYEVSDEQAKDLVDGRYAVSVEESVPAIEVETAKHPGEVAGDAAYASAIECGVEEPVAGLIARRVAGRLGYGGYTKNPLTTNLSVGRQTEGTSIGSVGVGDDGNPSHLAPPVTTDPPKTEETTPPASDETTPPPANAETPPPAKE